jgi:hypothetical protein
MPIFSSVFIILGAQPKLYMKKICFLLFATIASISFAQAQTPTDSLKQYLGTYKFPDGTVITEVVVTLDQNILNMSSTAGTSELQKLGVDSFSVVNFQGTAKFKRNADKKVVGITIDARGYLLEGTKSETTAYLLRREKH